MLKLLCGLLLLCALALAAPPKVDTLNAAAAKKRVERNRRGLFAGSVDDSKLDIENYAPLDIVEKSLEKNDGQGDNEINGTKKLADKDIEYYHKKNQGTVKTIVEEKARDGDKLENVFYHLSYEKTPDASLLESTPAPLWDTTVDTTDQTLDDYTTLADDEETTTTLAANKEPYMIIDNANERQPLIRKLSDIFQQDNEPLNDATVPSEENMNDNSSSGDNEQTVDNTNHAAAGWFNNWFGLGQPTDDVVVDKTTSSPARADTPDLDRAIVSQQFTILSPFYFGSIGLKSPSCPAHRPTLVTVYFFSFCV